MQPKRRNRHLGGFCDKPCIDKPNSVHGPCSNQLTVIYLGLTLLAGSSGTSIIKTDTALHPSKDLAVSPPHFGGIIPWIAPRDPFAFALGVTARTSILADDGNYPLPFYSLTEWEFGLSSPRSYQESGATASCRVFLIIAQVKQSRKQFIRPRVPLGISLASSGSFCAHYSIDDPRLIV